MPRTIFIAIVLAAIAVGGVFYQHTPACIGSYQIRYTSPLSPIVASRWDRADSRECELLMEELLELEQIASELGLTTNYLQSRLHIETLTPSGLQFECRIAFRGKDEAETRNVLHQLVTLSAESALERARHDQERTLTFAREYLAEIEGTRDSTDSSALETLRADRTRSIRTDVARWSEDELQSVKEKFNALLSASRKEPTVASCLEYIRQRRNVPLQKTLEFEQRCRASKPIGIAQWPTFSKECASDVTSHNSMESGAIWRSRTETTT